MEKLATKKRESGISRIVGVDESAEGDLLDYFKERFEKQPEDALEEKHTPELDTLISQINEKMREFMAQYGVQSLEIPSRNIHIFDKGKLNPQTRKQLEEKYEKIGGLYIPIKQLIVLFKNYVPGQKLHFAECLIHELMHLNSFASIQKVKKGGIETTRGEETIRLGVRRAGFEITSRNGKQYFWGVDEAITEELVIRFDRQYYSDFSDLKQEYDERKEAIEAIAKRSGKNKSEILISNLEHGPKDTEGGHKIILRPYVYGNEREHLNQLIDDLYEKNKNDLQTREEVFTLFAKAALNGRLLPLARLIEKTYGKGSFRLVGEHTAKQNEKRMNS